MNSLALLQESNLTAENSRGHSTCSSTSCSSSSSSKSSSSSSSGRSRSSSRSSSGGGTKSLSAAKHQLQQNRSSSKAAAAAKRQQTSSSSSMSPPQVAEVGGSASREEGESSQQQENGVTGERSSGTPSPGGGKSALHDLWKKNGTKAKRIVKLLRRKRQKQQKQQQQLQQNAAAAAGEGEGGSSLLGNSKGDLLAAVPLRSKQRDLLLPLGRNKKLKKKLEAALEVDPHDAETESEDEEDGASEDGADSDSETTTTTKKKDAEDSSSQVEVEFIPAEEAEGADGPIAQLAEAFADVFEKMNANLKPVVQEVEEEEEEEGLGTRGEVMEFDEEDEEEEAGKKAVPKSKQKRLHRPSICELKQKTVRPDRIEAWDATSADPFFLAFLKGLRNVVAVPQHWSQKRRYLQWKRGFEKPPFKLPPHIEATKITEIRSALVEAESQKTMRQRMREKVRPKANRLSIDYQVLHDCFFKHAVKPPLTKMGDLYYEGKEFLQAKKNVKPGQLSERLKEALGMGPLSPPPWLLNMQRYGPPPSYPRLRVPGLNAPIPPGASYGYQPGGWGRPPVDESGKLLFQVADEEAEEEEQAAAAAAGQALDMWGELPPDAEVQEEEEEEGRRRSSSFLSATAETPFAGGVSSVGGSTLGLESPATLELQQRRGASSVASSGTKAYTILTPQEATVQQGQLFGVKHTYRIPSGALGAGQQQPGSGVASGVQTPAGISTPRIASGNASPFVRASGINMPFSGLPSQTASGANTPLMGAPGGSATPLGITVSLNPNEMEQEGAFTADVIRQQLRQHEEAAARAKAAAGQIDPTELFFIFKLDCIFFRSKKKAQEEGRRVAGRLSDGSKIEEEEAIQILSDRFRHSCCLKRPAELQ
ncbi:hypothetical protein Efla_005692 [Eimeria flavescens]